MEMKRQFPRSHLSTLQRPDEGAALIATGANSLGPALPEQTGHGGFVRQTESPLVLKCKNKNWHATDNIDSAKCNVQIEWSLTRTQRHATSEGGLPCSRPTEEPSEWRHLDWLDTSWPFLCQSLGRKKRASPHRQPGPGPLLETGRSAPHTGTDTSRQLTLTGLRYI